MLKSSASGLTLIILQPSFSSIVNCLLHIQNLFLHDHIHQFLLQVCVEKGKNQVFCLEHSIEYT